MSFWDFFWLLIWSYVFFAYLMVLFRIITDLFRDPDVSGGMKAVWVIALVFLPFLTALIYLISRGKGMAERNVRQVEAAQQQQEAYIRQVAGSSSAEQIEKGRAMLEQGAITPDEFERLKAKALA